MYILTVQGSLTGVPQCHMSNLRNGNVTLSNSRVKGPSKHEGIIIKHNCDLILHLISNLCLYHLFTKVGVGGWVAGSLVYR